MIRAPAPPSPSGSGTARPEAEGAGPSRRLAALLFGLAMAVLLPALALGGAAAWQAMAGHRAAADGRLRDAARILVLAVDREIAGTTAALATLAAAPALSDPWPADLAALSAQARRVAQQTGAEIGIAARDGTLLLSTLGSSAGPATRADSPELVERVVATGRPAIGDLAVSAATGRFVLAVGVPAGAGDELALVVTASLDAARLQGVLAAQDLPRGAVAVLADSRGVVVARSDARHLASVGRPLAETGPRPPAGGDPALYRATGADGMERVLASRPLPSAPGWRLVVAQPAAIFAEGWRVPLLGLAAGGAAALLLGSGLALATARRILRPVLRLRDHALALAAARGGWVGTAATLPPAPIAELEQLRRGFAAAEAALRAREGELATVLEASGDGVLVLDRDWRVAFVSCRAAELAGGGRELRGQAIWDAFPAEVGGPFWDTYRRTMSERVSARVEGFYAPLGRTLNAESHPLMDGGIVVFLRDVTEERAAAARLAESEARFRGLAEALPTMAFERDAKGANSWCSASWSDYTGLAPAELAGQGWTRATHPDDLPEAMAAWDAAVAASIPYARHKRLRRADGAWRWHLVRAVPVRSPGGAVTRWLGAAADVHDFVEAEARIAESEARYRALVEVSPQVVWTADAEGRLTYANAAWWTTTGQAETPAMRREAWLSVLHPEDAQPTASAWAAARAEAAVGGAGHFETEFRLKRAADGAWRWFLSRARPERDAAGRVTRWVGVALDVQDRKMAEAALAESEARLRLALQAGQVGTFVRDLVTGELTWDERMRVLFGLPPEAEVTYDTFRAGLHPEDAPQLDAAIAAALDPASGGSFAVEYRAIPARDGAERHISAQGRVEFRDGRAVRIVGMASDVTPMRRAAQVLAREADQLERLAERRARALAESEARLAEAARMEALGRLAGGMAHDFNNVLQAVQGGLKLAERRLPGDPGGVRRYLTLATEATRRGAAVTGRLLSFARRGELQAEVVEPGPLLDELAEMLRHTIGPGIALRAEAPPGLPPLLADRSQLESVLVNLANNARDAMPQGGSLVLRAEAMPAHAPGAPAALARQPCLRLSVVDAGEGMSPEVLSRVTEPFFTTKPKGRGTGLGLAMARGFAEQSGGGLEIESAPGQGTTVSLWLPRAEAAAARAAPAAPAGRALPRLPATVLVAEDETELREMLAAELAERGFVVAEAPDVLAAIALLDTGLRPDAVVTDLAMPGGLDGLHLVEEARRRLPRLPAVLVTGHAGDAASDRLEAVERGGPFALVRKPAEAEVLAERLGRVLAQARAAAIGGAASAAD